MANLPLELFLIFGLAKVLAELFERFGQPGLIGEIIAGVILGPGLLGWVEPNQVLAALSELGVMFLLFRVGLEVKVSELFRVGPVALSVAVGGVLLPLLAGCLLLPAFGMSQIEAIFVGAAMVATSVGITAQVLSAKGLLEERASQVILAAAVIDDVLGLVVLAVVNSLARHTVDIRALAVTASMAATFTFVVARYGTTAVRRFSPRVGDRLQLKEAQFHMALIAVFALSVLATYIGIAAIVGAFLAGLAFSEVADRRTHDLCHGITELTLPFFLVGIGLELRLSVFESVGVAFLALGITLIALLTKLIGCGIPAAVLGPKDAARVGVGMMPRGEVGMVVAQLGLSLGVIEKSVYSVVVFMAVATTLIAPPLLKLAFKGVQGSIKTEEFSLT